MTSEEIAARRARAAEYDFRTLAPYVRFGTASDRYAGWLGQIYPPRYEPEISSRKRKLRGNVFEERTLPVESVADYFEHFGVLELDFTFYRPLLEPDGEPSNNWFVLRQYAEHAPDTARFLLKAPQQFFARKLRRSAGGKVRYENNPAFLDAEACTRRFLEPAQELLSGRLQGVLFEQEYQRVAESPPPEENIAELDAFFRDLPGEVQAHLELRSEHLLVPPYFDWLESRGLGFVFSHWTWLPALRKQWRLCGGRFTAADRTVVTRLLTPLDMPYAEAYARAYPFDAPAPGLSDTEQARAMILDATALAFQARRQDARLIVVSNNRAWGNAPALAQAVAYRILEEEEKHAAG